MQKLSIIQIGTGGWGSTWLKFIDDAPDWELAGVVSRGGRNLDNARDKWNLNDSQCFTDLDKALATGADAVLISAPHPRHAEFARRALRAGKHVLCEKPMAETLPDAIGMVEEAEKAGRLLIVSQNMRYRKGIWRLRDALRGKAIDSLHVQLFQKQDSNWPEWRLNGPNPLLLEIFIHQADMARFLLGSNARTVDCKAWNPEYSLTREPSSANVYVEFENGTRLTYTASWVTKGITTSWEGVWRAQTGDGVVTWDGTDIRSDGIDVPPEASGFPGEDRNGILRDFARAIRGTQPMMTTGADNLNSLALVLAAIESGRRNQEVSLDAYFAEQRNH